MPSNRTGGWLLTAHGHVFYPLDPRPEEIFIEDIAHALSRQCRFGGHTRHYYSVAQHSVLVSGAATSTDRGIALCGLLHDATEAYLVDVPTPVKAELREYRDIETNLWLAIADRFSLPAVMPDEVHQADLDVLFTERRDLLPRMGPMWSREQEAVPLVDRIVPWTVEFAESEFMARFYELGGT